MILRHLRRGCTDDRGVRLLHRLPTDGERAVLTRRQAALEIAATPAVPQECAVAIAQMLAGFPSYRAAGEDFEIMATQYATVLRRYPAWAIRAACGEISSGRLIGDEVLGLNPAFPPSAQQVAVVTAREVRALERELAEVREVIAGRVEDQAPRPTQAEIEAKLGRSIGRPPSGLLAPLSADRIAALNADLAGRRARNAQQESAEGSA